MTATSVLLPNTQFIGSQIEADSPATSNGSYDALSPVEQFDSVGTPGMDYNYSESGPPDVSAILTKKWDIIPRPKPGRKPAQDTPPTKRKAQNRAAQRAFRERRAARVGELEDEKQQQQQDFDGERRAWAAREMEWAKKETTSLDKVSDLERQIDHLRRSLDAEIARREGADMMMRQMQKQIDLMPHRTSFSTDVNGSSCRTITSAVSPPIFAASTMLPSLDQSGTANALSECSNTCGQPGGSCRCIEAVLQSIDSAAEATEQAPGAQLNSPDPSIDYGTDFTAKFARPQPQQRHSSGASQGDNSAPSAMLPLEENCGFCENDPSACLCRDGSSVNVPMLFESPEKPRDDHQLPSITPSASGSGIPFKLPVKRQAMEPPVSTSGPGSCPACLSDPKRRSFCVALASSVSASSPRGSSATTTSPTTTTTKPRSTISTSDTTTLPQPSTDTNTSSNPHNPVHRSTVSCADAYSMLSASDPDLHKHIADGTFLASLHAQPARNKRLKCATCKDTGCSPLEVDIAGVLTAMSRSSGGGRSMP